MAKNTPAFQFYPQDFIGGTCHMSNEEVGLYIRLLSLLWIRGGTMPFDVERLARMTGTPLLEFDRLWQELQSKFEIAGNVISHARFDEMIATRERRQAAGSLTGKLGGRPTKETQSKGKDKGNQKANETQSKGNVMKNEDRSMKDEDCSMKDEDCSLTTEKESRYTPDFETFWNVYPPKRKNKKGKCFQYWNRAIQDGVTSAEIIDAATEFASSLEGLSDFCPSPAPWLNACRWEDDRNSWRTSQIKATTSQDLPRSVKNEIAGRTMKDAAREQHCKQQRIEEAK